MFNILHLLLILPLPVETFVEANHQFSVVLWGSIIVSAVKPGLNVIDLFDRMENKGGRMDWD